MQILIPLALHRDLDSIQHRSGATSGSMLPLTRAHDLVQDQYAVCVIGDGRQPGDSGERLLLLVVVVAVQLATHGG